MELQDYLRILRKRWLVMLRVEVAEVPDDCAVVTEPVPAAHDEHLSRILPWGREVFVPRHGLERVADSAGELAGIWAHDSLPDVPGNQESVVAA